MSENLRIGFIGAGRVAKALTLALARAGENIVAVASRSVASAQACATGAKGCQAVSDPQQVIDATDLVFLAVPDDAIAELAASLRWRDDVMVVHCSGATELTALEAARAAGAQTGSFHPLLMFADAQVAAGALARGAIALEAGKPLLGVLEALVKKLGAQSVFVPAGARAAYHAASHYGAAFICVLLDEGQKILQMGGMKGEVSRKALLSLARGTLDALEHADPAHAMAGVYSRGDVGTARRHLNALDTGDAPIALLYRELARRSVALALQAGRIDAGKADLLRDLLDE
ncbi:MAG: Rossmann-like and DUF2520 domain-containing protein [Burkholderiales bacterium]